MWQSQDSNSDLSYSNFWIGYGRGRSPGPGVSASLSLTSYVTLRSSSFNEFEVLLCARHSGRCEGHRDK